MNAERADQYRGITYLAQVIEPLLQINRYTQAELVAALVQSFSLRGSSLKLTRLGCR